MGRTGDLPVNKINVTEDEMQLVLRVLLTLPDGKKMLAKALVDTGAQVNIVRQGLVPQYLMEKATDPVRLVAANQEIIPGGDKK